MIQKLLSRYDHFLNNAGSLRQVAIFRIGYGLLLLVCLAFWALDSRRLFSDEGLMSLETAHELISGTQYSLFDIVPSSPQVVHAVIALCIIQAICLVLGIFSRFQALSLFILLATLHHRNPLSCDGEDTLFRLFAFFLIFMPLDAEWSVMNRLRGKGSTLLPSTWALRLVQLQISLVYASTAWAKYQGVTWRDGTATYLVLQMPDLYGRGWVPEFLESSDTVLRLATWSVLLVEGLLPIGLWIPKTRHFAVIVALLMHLSIEYTMHLFLFEWIMMLGLLTFVDWSKVMSRFQVQSAPRNELQLSS